MYTHRHVGDTLASHTNAAAPHPQRRKRRTSARAVLISTTLTAAAIAVPISLQSASQPLPGLTQASVSAAGAYLNSRAPGFSRDDDRDSSILEMKLLSFRHEQSLRHEAAVVQAHRRAVLKHQEALRVAARHKAAVKLAAKRAPVVTTPVVVEPPIGTLQTEAKQWMIAYGFPADQWTYLDELITRESGWRIDAANPSGAYGLPQALPGSKMASAGPNWQSDPKTQLTWMFGYIKARYGNPAGAWAHSQASGWY